MCCLLLVAPVMAVLSVFICTVQEDSDSDQEGGGEETSRRRRRVCVLHWKEEN